MDSRHLMKSEQTAFSALDALEVTVNTLVMWTFTFAVWLADCLARVLSCFILLVYSLIPQTMTTRRPFEHPTESSNLCIQLLLAFMIH